MKKKWEENKHDLCFHNTVISGLVPHALIKMVYTRNFTFQTSLNERSLPNALWTLLPSCRIFSTGQGTQLIVWLYRCIIMTQQYQQNLKFLRGSPHPSTIQALCCLTLVFKWELVYLTTLEIRAEFNTDQYMLGWDIRLGRIHTNKSVTSVKIPKMKCTSFFLHLTG